MQDWIKIVLANSVVGGLIWLVLQQYTIAKIRHRLEPLTAEETLRRQNLLNSKLKAYQEACDVVCRSLAAKPWSGGTVPPGRVAAKTAPSESEINKCAATLALFTSDVRIRDTFIKCFQTCTPADLGSFAGLLRQDLGYGESHFVPDQYPYIFGHAT